MMGMVSGHLVRFLLHLPLEILFVVSVAHDLDFLFRLELSQLVKW